MKKTLYLMRHGQTIFNERNIVQGFCDSPLTELGRRQPLYAKHWFENRNIVFDHAYSSTQERASDTLELVTDIPYTRLKAIKEMSFGTFEGKSNDLMHKEVNWTEDPDAMVKFGGESFSDVQNRVVSALTEVMSQDDHLNVLAVSHGCTIFAFAHKWIPNLTRDRFQMSNCCILKFKYEDGKFNFIEDISHDFDQEL